MIQSIFLLLAFSSMRGLNEGIVMYQSNARQHPWFAFYHLMRVLEYGFFAAFVYFIPAMDAWQIAAALLLAWEVFEAAYCHSRRGQADNHENILGIFPVDGAVAVVIIHIARTVIGLALAWRFL